MVTNKQIQSENLKKNIEALKVEVSLLRDAYFQLEEAKKQLKKNEEQYRLLTENNRDLIWTTDIKGKITFVNPTVTKLLGYKRAEVLGESCFKLMTKESVKNANALRKMMNDLKKKGVSFELEYVHKNGTVIPFDVSISIIRDENGSPVSIQGSSRDITEKRYFEEKLKENEEKYRLLYETSSDAIMTLEPPDWKFTSGNSAIVKMFGVKNEKEFISLAPWQVSPKYQPDGQLSSVKAKEMIEIAMKKGFNFFEWTHKKVHGEDFFATVLLNRVQAGEKIFLQARVTDITHRKQIEDTLLESENRYHALFEGTYDLIQSVTPEGKFDCVNKAWLNKLDYSEKEVENLIIWDIIAPKSKEHCKKLFTKCMKGIVLDSVEAQFITKNGNIIDVEGNISVRKENGKIIATNGFFRDVTENKASAERLKKSEERFRDVALSSADWIWEVDLHGKYTYASDGVKKILGYTQKEIIGKTPFDLMPKEEAQRVGTIFKEIVSKKKPIVDLENLNITKDGEKVFLLTNGVPILDQNGKLAGYRGVDKNITQRKKAEMELIKKIKETVRQKDKINTIVESIGDGVFVVDKDLRIALFNPIASQISGFSEKEVLGKKYSDILKFVFESDINEINDRFVENTIRTGKVQGMSNHTLLVHKSGDLIPVADSASPLEDEKGKIVGCVVVFRDATRERNIDKVKTEFVSIASHQLRTPLSGIKWFTELLLKQKVGKLNDEQKDYVNQVHVSNERLIRLVSDLLDVSHIETGRKFFVEMKKTNLSEIVKQVLEGSIGMIKDKKLKIDVCKELASKVYLTVDPDKIRQVFYNIITNAIKYSKNSGKIDLCLKSNKKDIVFFVKDRGLGIPRRDQERIFEKFFRADNVMTTQTDGTGLGLYITKAIVEAHGGKVWFQSKAGKGTTFFFSLPKKAKKSKKY